MEVGDGPRHVEEEQWTLVTTLISRRVAVGT
jgi:hypothetical protein